MSEPYRILHVVHVLNRGGMESRLMDLYRHLDRSRFQYDFYIESGKRGMFDEEVEKLGGRVLYSGEGQKHGVPNLRAWRHFLAANKTYEAVCAYNQWAGWYLREAKRQGVPVRIACARTSLQTASLKNLVKNTVKLNVNYYATHKFAVSKIAGVWLFGRRAVEKNEVLVWPNAINTKQFRLDLRVRKKLREELGTGDALTVMHVGNLRFEKNHPFLLEVFAEIVKKQKNARLILVGNGSFESLREQMASLGITGEVCHLGVRSDIPDLLQAADLFIFPSLYEGFPGAVLEAETSGLPCVISDTITDEVVLTERVKQMSLKDSPKQWAAEALQLLQTERADCVDAVKAAGYDIHDLVRRMEAFYSQCQGDERKT